MVSWSMPGFARAHDFGHESRRINNEPCQQSREFGRHGDATRKVEALQDGHFKSERCTARKPAQDRKNDQQRQSCTHQRKDAAGGILALLGPRPEARRVGKEGVSTWRSRW